MRKTIIAVGVLVAALAGLPAVAQEAEVLVASGPGVAGAAGTVTLKATITAIDAERREVTLTGADAGQMVVVAGPEVKNFAQLAVGDAVQFTIAKALKLELRKGSTAAVSRVDEAGKVGAEAGQKPGGAIARKVVVMAEVTALDAATHTVTLRGPQQSLDLQIADPEQYKAIAVGDRVEATFVEAVAVDVTKAAAAE